MRLLVTSLCFVFVLFYESSFSQKNLPNPVFEIYEYDFGDLEEGEKREFVFQFKNKGTVPVIISNVHVQCGCTAPEWSDTPVMPNEMGSIKIVYDSSGKEGVQRKIISVESNYSELVKLKIIANVLTD